MKKYFGKGGNVLTKDNRKVKADEKGWTMFNDDYTPDAEFFDINLRRVKMKTIDNGKNYNYF